MVFYAVANGRTIGIFLNWNDCNNSVKGYKNASYKKFNTKEEAENFIQSNNNIIEVSEIKIKKQNPISSFFDSVNSKEKEKDSEIKNKEKENQVDFIPEYYVYTDGACSNNGKSYALAGIGIFFWNK